jgi:hypothetical protein
MNISILISKLNKLNISHEIVNNNGYNADIKFTVNNKVFLAGIVNDKDNVEYFCHEICYDNTSQEMNRRFFQNFNQLLKYANR